MPSPGGSEPGATPYAPSWPRKPHTKTRSGCTVCKRRKIKCDEQKPSCANCIKHGVHCNYAPWTARRWHGTTSHRSPGHQGATSPSHDLSRHQSPSGNALLFNETHLELLHHFTTVTYNTLTAHPTLKVMWRITVPQLGLKHPFLMRSIFAISALHLAVLRPQRRSFYVDVSREEHSAALAMAVPLISNANEDNASALFAFSMLAVIYILAAPREPGDHWLLVPEGGLTDWLALIQGTRSVSTSYQEHLSKGPVSPLFTVSQALVSNAEEKGQSLPAWKGSSEYRQMVLLRQLIRERVDNAQRLKQYETLLDLLEQSFAANMVSPTSYCQETLSDDHEQVATSHIFSFLYRSLEIMQGPLQAREPEALVIFAYYCVLLHKLEGYWWIQTLPRDIMEEIWGALNYEYRYWIQWPAEQLGWAPRDP